MDFRERVIKEIYGGDVTRYEREFDASIEEANAEVIRWEDLNRSATVLPELSQQAKEQIEYFLGYLPHESTTIPFEPFLRSLIQQKNSGQLSTECYNELAEKHVRFIRNWDFRFNLADKYDPEIYKTYHREYIPHGLTARTRIENFLGYAPALDHSLVAELYFRNVIANDRVRLPPFMTAVDYRVLSLIRYREILLGKGKEAADDSPLFKQEEADWLK